MDKQLVFVARESIRVNDMFDDVTFDEAISNVNLERKLINQKYPGMNIGKIQVEYNYDYTNYYIDIHREETDEEYAKRIQNELEKAEQRRLKKERKAAAKAEKAKVDAQKELEELEELRKRVAELEQKHNITLE